MEKMENELETRELHLSYYIGQARLITIYAHCGNLC